MPFSQPFDDAFRRDVEVMIQDSTLSDNALHNDAEQYLQVLARPSFGDIDQPAWVRRIQRFWGLSITYTSTKLFDALYHTADELGLVSGKRYVSAAICLCASHAANTSDLLQDNPRRIVEALSQLASAWIAFMLWPFFVDGEKASQELLARRQVLESQTMVPQSHDGQRFVIKEDLLKWSGYTCFMLGSVHLRAPREQIFGGPDRVTIDDLQVAQIFRPPSAMRERGMREDDEVVTSDILKHYCYPINVDGVEATEDAIEARNSLVLGVSTCQAFNTFRWCLHPSPVANQYRVEVHQRYNFASLPRTVTFEDHSHKYSSSSDRPTPLSSSCGNPLSPRPQAHISRRRVDPPSAELLRVHAALAGVMHLSGAIKAFDAIFYSCGRLDESCIPGASGSIFLQSVVAYEGRDVCLDSEMRRRRERVPVEGTADEQLPYFMS